ncbi:hypothetical protein [Streptomyces cadmiisoli]|uniref:hypothetical protein n=1 Tax=Streptomyces cadmiisoli TaxID=2184053 RepID=UPI003D738388
MSHSIVFLLFVAGISEAVGRYWPFAVRRPGISQPATTGLLLVGGLIEAAVFALWPITAWALAGVLPSSVPPNGFPAWTPGTIAPLVFTGVLALPCLGPVFRWLFVAAAGAGLAGLLAEATALEWRAAAGCVAVAAAGTQAAAQAVRHLAVQAAETWKPIA